MSKEIKGVVNRLDLFTTPLWYVERDLPEGAYEWALDIEKNVEGREVSNLSLIHISEPTRPY